MKKCLNKIPKNKFGASDATKILTGIGQLGINGMQAVANSQQNGVTVSNSIGSTLNSAVTGAELGSMFGPIGTGIGAVAGGLTGLASSLVGRKGSVDPVTGEVTEGSGIKGRRGPDKNELYARSREIRRNNALREYNATAAYDWYQENGANGYTLAAKGGVIPNALAYVDDGELLRTPDGNIINIPEQGKPTDSNLVSVPEGTQVLSDKLKVPGTKETFAEAGRKLIKKQKYGNDIYAQNSKMLNERHNQKAYDELLTIQEDMKKKKGIKKSIGKYDDGTKNVRSADDLSQIRDIMPNVTPELLSQMQSSLHPYLDLSDLADTTQARTIPRVTRNITNSEGKAGNNSRDFNLRSTIGDLSPLISGLSSFVANTQNAKDLEPEPVYPRYARAYFSPVEYNIQPQLDAINRTNAIARYNETQLAPRTGANLAFGIQSAVARNRAINEAYNNQRAINNQTRARNAQIATATSQFNAQTQHTADVENAQNRAQARNLRRQYRSANAAIIPAMLRDMRQNRRDQALLEYMRPFLEYGSTSEVIANLFKGMR